MVPKWESDMFRQWEAFQAREVWRNVAAQRTQAGEDTSVAEEALRELPDVSAIEALQANATLVNRLIGSRWPAMRAAREAGASWSEIGEALGMSKQGAQDWYRRTIAEQERHLGDLHEVDRSRAALK